MSDAVLDLRRKTITGTAPKVEIDVYRAANGHPLERIRIAEGALVVALDPLASPAVFLGNFALALLRRSGTSTAKRVRLEAGTRVGGWVVGDSPLFVDVTYLGGGNVEIAWTDGELLRVYDGPSNDKSETVQVVAALSVVATKRALLGA